MWFDRSGPSENHHPTDVVLGALGERVVTSFPGQLGESDESEASRRLVGA